MPGATIDNTEATEFFHVPSDGNGPPDGSYTDRAEFTDEGDTFNTRLGQLGDPVQFTGDIVHAGGGVDNATFPGPMEDYSVTFRADGSISVYTSRGFGGGSSITLYDVETLTFTDGYISRQNGPIAIYGGISDRELVISDDGGELWVEQEHAFGATRFITAEGPGHRVHFLAKSGNDNLTVRGDLSDNLYGDWIDGLIQFYWSGGPGDNSITFEEGAVIPFAPRTYDVLRSYGVSIELWGDNDAVDAAALNSPVFVAATMFGDTEFGIDTCHLSTECTGDFVEVIAPAGATYSANLATNTLTRNAMPVFSSFSGVDNLRLPSGNVSFTGHSGGNIVLLGQGIHTFNGGGHGLGEIDALGINGYNVFGGVTFNFETGIATGPSFNATMTGANAAFGGNSADDFIMAGPELITAYGMPGDDDFTIAAGAAALLGYEAPRSGLEISGDGDGTWQIYDIRDFNEVPSGKLREGLDTVSGDVSKVFVRTSDQVFKLDQTGSGELDVAVSRIATGEMPTQYFGGDGTTDRLTLNYGGKLGTGQKVQVDVVSNFGNGRVELRHTDADQHQTLIEIDGWEDLGIAGDIDVTIAGDYGPTDIAQNTITLTGGTSGNNFDASGIVSNHRVVMQGLGGNDTLAGGAANDVLNGGSGSGDVASFAAATSAIVHTLAAGGSGSVTAAGMGTDSYTGMEGLSGGSANDRLTGNAAANFLGGHTGNDKLSGLDGNDTLNGGAGQDEMTGGIGNDSFYVDEAGDKTIEAVGEGTDTVYSTISRTLAANVEILSLQGSANLTGNGNTLANKLYGNAGDNVLQGLDANDTIEGGDGNDELKGGTGSDSMVGGNGNDRYFVDSAGDVVSETVASLATGGNDTVFSQIAYTLGANVEILRLQGAGNLSGTGNALNNNISGTTGANLLRGLAGNDVLVGNDGADTLEGGAGNDTLSGGSQADVFRFTTTNAGADTITDFNKNADRFDLGGGFFSQLTTASDGDVILKHNGGTIRIDAPLHNLTLAQYNALVLPGGGAGGAGLFAAAPDMDLVQLHGDWVFA